MSAEKTVSLCASWRLSSSHVIKHKSGLCETNPCHRMSPANPISSYCLSRTLFLTPGPLEQQECHTWDPVRNENSEPPNTYRAEAPMRPSTLSYEAQHTILWGPAHRPEAQHTVVPWGPARRPMRPSTLSCKVQNTVLCKPLTLRNLVLNPLGIAVKQILPIPCPE